MITPFAIIFGLAIVAAFVWIIVLAVKGEAQSETERENIRYRRIVAEERAARAAKFPNGRRV